MERQIVVPLDGSALAEAALPHAVLLARASDSALHLLRTVAPANAQSPLAWPMPDAASLEGWLREERAAAGQYLARLAARLQSAGLAVMATVVEGNPAEMILRMADELPAVREIVMASHGRRGMERWTFGSVAEKVLHTTPVPVLVVPVHAPEEADPAPPPLAFDQRYATILVPLDGSEFAEQALGPARLLAERCDARLVVLSVIPPIDNLRLGEGGVTPLWMMKDQLSARQYIADYLQEVSQRMARGRVPLRTRWVDGRPAAQIPAVAAEEQADLIVMATHGRSGLSKLWLGSVASRVIERTDLPVLLVRAQEEQVIGG